MRLFCILVAITLVSARAESVFHSGPDKVSLLELYTSEGCSSCPPAESWLSGLSSDHRIWKEIVPVAFHVDYWDALGWKDRFSKREYTARQRSYSIVWGTSSVYTPGFVLDGREWKGWFAGNPLPGPAQHGAGVLEIRVANESARIRFAGDAVNQALEVHVVPLAMNVNSEVRAGENQGRKLTHSFVALDLITARLTPRDGTFSGEVPVNLSEASAVAIWVTSAGSLTPLQAAGGMIR